MSDYMTRGFRAQLTTVMDSVLRTAVFEITKIFENSLCDYHTELAQKGEEIAQLKMKLQKTKLQGSEDGRNRGEKVEVDTKQSSETQKEIENSLCASTQTLQTPEIDFEVPDDWCAPLGSETLTKQEDSVAVCPSVRLRRLSIPLWHIPIIKQERVNCDIDSLHPPKVDRGDKKGSSLNKTNTQRRSLRDLRSRRRPGRNDVTKLLQDIQQEYSDLQVNTVQKRRGRSSTGKAQEQLKKDTKEKGKGTAKPESKEQVKVEESGKTYSCRYCKKLFNSEFGRNVHVRSHKKCQGCKKIFPFPSALKYHKHNCQKFQRLLEKAGKSIALPKPARENENLHVKNTAQVIDKVGTLRPDPSASTQEDGVSTKIYTCQRCNKQYNIRSKFREHVRGHISEKPFPCSICSRAFFINRSLRRHMRERHKNHLDPEETNQDLAWTEPLEEPDDNGEDSVSLSKAAYNTILKECRVDMSTGSAWQTMGIRCSNGFSCIVCTKLIPHKYKLIEHFRIHTGERPILCEWCPKTFRTKSQYSTHKRKCKFARRPLPCDLCEKTFFTGKQLSRHKMAAHNRKKNQHKRKCPHCRKVFLSEGTLKRHILTFHK